MSIKRTNLIYLIILILIFCLINPINSHESAIGQMVYANFTEVGAPIFVIKQIGEDAVTFGGQLKYKFQDPDPDKYVFILRNGDSIYAIYNFGNLDIKIKPPNTEPFSAIDVQGKIGYNFVVGATFEIMYHDSASNKTSFPVTSTIFPCNTLCKNG
ncbi:hypothetical protein C2G38_2084152 [Gigaspora rosea]|uniref:Uncharacterized protein n=1 Tax=Gigaspora rosea TaxID=44941 RepID=A0A397VAF3_9GLOM|nr:hypothetical protein C2G38_2084152 [Gigaspora rosea]